MTATDGLAQTVKAVDSSFCRFRQRVVLAVAGVESSYLVTGGAVSPLRAGIATRIPGGDMIGDMNNSADKTVVLDSGWVDDGHELCWNHEIGFIGHPPDCPHYWEGPVRKYLCSPGIMADNRAVSISDFSDEDAEDMLKIPMGSKPIIWRLTEYLHPDLSREQENKLSIFEVALAEIGSKLDEEAPW